MHVLCNSGEKLFHLEIPFGKYWLPLHFMNCILLLMLSNVVRHHTSCMEYFSYKCC